MECGICYETKSENNFEVFDCYHSACKSCFSRFRKHICPFCRQPIPNSLNEDRITQMTEEEEDNLFIFNNHIDNATITRTRHRRRRRRSSPVHQQIPDTTLINDNVVVEIIEQLQELEPVENENTDNTSRKRRVRRPHNNRWHRINHLYNHAHNQHV